MDKQRAQYLIEQYLDAALTPEEREEFDRLRVEHPDFDRRITEERRLHDMMRGAKSENFKPFFDARVMRRIADEQRGASATLDLQFTNLIPRLFPRVAAPALLGACLFMAVNFNAAVADASLVDALLGLPSDNPVEFALML